MQRTLHRTGKGGCKHQIDIYWEYEKDEENKKVIIECKDYKNPVSISRVRDFYGVRCDIGDTEAWIVSPYGFQKGAQIFAKHYDIKLKTLKWFENLTFEFNIPRPFLKYSGFSIKNKKYDNSDISIILDSGRFSSNDENYADLNFHEFLSYLSKIKKN